MKHTVGLFTTCFLTAIVAVQGTTVADDSAKKQTDLQRGYVQCGIGKNRSPVLVFEHPCKPQPVGELKCGDSVEMFSRDGPWLKIRSADGAERYIGVASVSKSRKKFLPIDLPAPPGPYIPDCSAFWPKQSGTHRPIPHYSPDPEYPEEARRHKISGSVLLSLTVGTDGIAHDVTVTKSLGHGFDENAVRSIQEWRFEPAAENGKPVPARITVEVDFSIDK